MGVYLLRLILPVLLLGAWGAQPRPEPARQRRPNILFILPDQLRAQSLGYLGNRDVRTPNIDRLAAEGLTFTQAFANTPVCCPARANLLTGKYARRNGMVANDLRLRETETTLAELLKQAGWHVRASIHGCRDSWPGLPIDLAAVYLDGGIEAAASRKRAAGAISRSARA